VQQPSIARLAGPRGRLASKRSSSQRRASFHDRYRSALGQVELSWLVIWLETAPGQYCCCPLIPLAAQLTPANVADQGMALALVRCLSPDVRYILGDTHYNDPILRLQCEQQDCFLIATHKGT
jgi:hypothetical protein